MPKVLVIGDSCIDIFEYGHCTRICPEAPVPVLTPTIKKENYGMSMNVYENLIGLGITCDIITNNHKPIKIRYIDETSNQMIVRVDREDYVESLDWGRLRNIIFSNYDAIVISDYNKGFISTDQIEFISKSHELVFLDTKKKIDKWANDINFIKINEKEFTESKGYLSSEYKGNIIVTLGKNGSKLCFRYGEPLLELTFSIEKEHHVRDLTGAGDTFLAALVSEYLSKRSMDKSIIFANKCAAWAVTQKGVAVVDINKIEL